MIFQKPHLRVFENSLTAFIFSLKVIVELFYFFKDFLFPVCHCLASQKSLPVLYVSDGILIEYWLVDLSVDVTNSFVK